MSCLRLPFIIRCFLLLPISCLPVHLLAEANPVAELDTVRANLSQALQYRDQAAHERADWAQRQAELNALLLVSEEKKRNLEATLAIVRPILENLQARKNDLAAQDEETQALNAYLRTAAPALAGKLLAKSTAWPEPLIALASDPLQKLRVLTAVSKKYSDQELENLVQASIDALEKALQFQSKIHHTTAVKTLPGGPQALYEIITLGLGGGYYLSTDLNQAGKIVWHDHQWQWIAGNDLVAPLQNFLAILAHKQTATWISLPVEISVEGATP